MKKKHYIVLAIGTLFCGVLVFCSGLFVLGNTLIAPAFRNISQPPSPFNEVEFYNGFGERIRGWYGYHEQAVASVMLLHGVRSNRREMQERAKFLYQQQMNVLLFDFQAHGESGGEAITFGSREAHDAEAAFQFLRQQDGAAPIGAVGFSLGGAAVLLSPLTQKLDFLIAEAVYPDIETAISNRLRMRLGTVGGMLTPLLSGQLRWRLGVAAEQLRPIAGVPSLQCPLLVIGGSEDRRTTPADTRRLFDAASGPKELWIVEGAQHQNFHAYAPDEYEQRVLSFISHALGE